MIKSPVPMFLKSNLKWTGSPCFTWPKLWLGSSNLILGVPVKFELPTKGSGSLSAEKAGGVRRTAKTIAGMNLFKVIIHFNFNVGVSQARPLVIDLDSRFL